MTTTPCPGCGMPRAAELSGSLCPVCGPTPAAVPDAPAEVARPQPVPPPPPQSPPSQTGDRWRLILLVAAVALSSGSLGWWAGRASIRPAPLVEAAPAPEPSIPPPARPQVAPPPRPVVPTVKPPAVVIDLPRSERSVTAELVLVLIPAGSFKMGSWEHESARQTEEVEHPVRITRPFYLATHEVTQAEYRLVTGTNPSWFSKTGGGAAAVAGIDDTGRFPVERVTWYDAAGFCNALSRADGYEPYYALDVVTREGQSVVAAKVRVAGRTGYRLPTEAEWEYACRAGTKTPFYFGGENTGEEANVKASTVASGYGTALRWREIGRTCQVGRYAPNRWGLYDMHGNVAEWCQDWYERGYYSRSPDADPPGADEGSQRVQRGGSWLVGEYAARSACRFPAGPASATSHGGFRVARTP